MANIHITTVLLTGETQHFDINSNNTILQLETEIYNRYPQFNHDNVMLLCQGTDLHKIDNSKQLKDIHFIQPNTTINLVKVSARNNSPLNSQRNRHIKTMKELVAQYKNRSGGKTLKRKSNKRRSIKSRK